MQLKPMEDTSQILPPMNSERPLLQQVISALIDGTDEVRNYLSSGCNVILECSECRSLFRGLPNFICHRRQFCRRPSVDQQLREQASGSPTPAGYQQQQPQPCRGFVDFCRRLCNESGKDDSKLSSAHLSLLKQRNQSAEPEQQQQQQQLRPDSHPDESFTKTLPPSLQMHLSTARPSSAPPPHHSEPQQPPESPIVVVQPRDPIGYVRMETRRKVANAADEEPDSDPAAAEHEFDEDAFRRLGKRTDCDVKRLVCCLCSIQLPSLVHLETHLEWLHSSQRSTKAARHCPACRLLFPTSTDCLVHLQMRHGVTPETARIPHDLLLKMELAEQRERDRVHRVRLSDPTGARHNNNNNNSNSNNNNNDDLDDVGFVHGKSVGKVHRRHARSGLFGGSKRSRSGRRLTATSGKRQASSSSATTNQQQQPQQQQQSSLLTMDSIPSGHKCPVCGASFITMGGASLHAQDEHPDVAIYLPCLLCPVRCWARSAHRLQEHLAERHPLDWSSSRERLIHLAWRDAVCRRRSEPVDDLPAISGAANPKVTASGALKLTFSNLATVVATSAAPAAAPAVVDESTTNSTASVSSSSNASSTTSSVAPVALVGAAGNSQVSSQLA